MLKVGDIATLKLDGVAFGGVALGRIEGVVVFVPFGVDGDEVRIEITEVKKNYCRARIEEILVPSPARIEAKCPYFTICGGCQYQHISYEHQLELKEKQVAESFERIHRSNLVGMGILPLEFQAGENAEGLGLTGEEVYTIRGLSELTPKGLCQVIAEATNGEMTIFQVTARVDTPAELNRVRMGGILHEALLEA